MRFSMNRPAFAGLNSKQWTGNGGNYNSLEKLLLAFSSFWRGRCVDSSSDVIAMMHCLKSLRRLLECRKAVRALVNQSIQEHGLSQSGSPHVKARKREEKR